jgi:hypothetical protein
MSREDDERRMRKLQYLEQRGVATLEDKVELKKLARKMAIEDFDRLDSARRQAAPRPAEVKKGTLN